MRTPIELLRVLHDGIERDYDDGFTECSYCNARGWAFIEHDASCPVREMRALLGKCRHGFTGGYNHGGGRCQAEKYKE